MHLSASSINNSCWMCCTWIYSGQVIGMHGHVYRVDDHWEIFYMSCNEQWYTLIAGLMLQVHDFCWMNGRGSILHDDRFEQPTAEQLLHSHSTSPSLFCYPIDIVTSYVCITSILLCWGRAMQGVILIINKLVKINLKHTFHAVLG